RFNVTFGADAAWRSTTGRIALCRIARHYEPGNFFCLEDRQHAGLPRDHEPGAHAAVAAVGRFFSSSGARGRRTLEPVAAGRCDAAQSAELCRWRRTAALNADSRISRRVGPWPDYELPCYAGICRRSIWAGSLDQP